jgi:hypothetical protein
MGPFTGCPAKNASSLGDELKNQEPDDWIIGCPTSSSGVIGAAPEHPVDDAPSPEE